MTGSIAPYCHDFTGFLDPQGLRGMRVGVSRTNLERLPKEHQVLAERAFAALEQAGAVTVDAPLPKYNSDWASSILLFEFRQCLNAYLATCPDPGVRTLAELIDVNNADSERCLQYGQSIALEAQHRTSGTLTEPGYLRNRARTLRESRARVDSLLREHNLSCIAMAGWNDIPPSSGYPGHYGSHRRGGRHRPPHRPDLYRHGVCRAHAFPRCLFVCAVLWRACCSPPLGS